MSTGVPSPVDDLSAFTARLDGLHADQTPDDLSHALRNALDRHALYSRYIFSLVGDVERAKALLEIFDKALKATESDDTVFKQFRKLCGWTGLLPTSYTIPEKLVQQSTEQPVASGAFSDVWEGIHDGKLVAVKALRVFKEDDIRKAKKVFCEEVATWKRVFHPNIVPFLGVSGVYAPLCVVSEWMPNGNVRDYVGKNPEISRLQLLLDISSGLSFLHSLEVVHGDLRGDNVLVDKSGFARLSDFGLARITSLSCMEAPASRFKGSQRWMAPELFNINNGEFGLPRRESDIFALGMVTFEVFTGQVPFPESKSLAVVTKKIIYGEQPPKPRGVKKLGLSNEFWKVIQSSLAHEVEKRPSAPIFADFLKKATPNITVLEELTGFDAKSEKHKQKLRHVFDYGNNTLLGMREEETLTLVEIFDRVLNSSLDDPILHNQCLHGLQKVSARCGLLPKSYSISYGGLIGHNAASATGRVSSTRQWSISGKLVAVKIISPDRIKDFNAFKRRLCTSMVTWKQLEHPNIVSFLGFDFNSNSPSICLVYPWMPNGNLPSYVCEHPDVDKLGLLLNVVRGLTYLHRHNLVHGNLTECNILVDSDGIARISEYDLRIILCDEASPESTLTNVRWMAPEVLSTKYKCIPSVDGGKASDVYSFAMVMFKTLTGTTPFQNENDGEIADKVSVGLRPEWPPNKPRKRLREQIKSCWNQEPNERPSAFRVLRDLVALSEVQPQEPLVSAEDHTMRTEQVYADDCSEEMPPKPEERKGFNNLPNNTLVMGSSTSDSTPPHHHVSGTPISGRSGHDSGKAEGRKREILKSPRRALGEIAGKLKPAVEKSTPGLNFTARREEEVTVRGNPNSVPYIISRPIPRGKKLRKVVITIVSKDQGWTDYPEDYCTYRNSRTWFELSVSAPSNNSRERWRGLVVRNLHAYGDFKEHTIEMSDEGLYAKARGGNILTVWAHAGSPPWTNTVKKVEIRWFVG